MGGRDTPAPQHQGGKGKWIIHDPVPEGITLSGPVIVSRKDTGIRVFSSACTHLGCRIDRIKNDRLVCPCHGSEYSPEGVNLKGPAGRPLKELSFHPDGSSGRLVVNLEQGP
jgi:Rieske Fe-S protein